MKLTGLMPGPFVDKKTFMLRLRCLALSVVADGLVCNMVGGCAVVFKSYMDDLNTLAWTEVTCGSPGSF